MGNQEREIAGIQLVIPVQFEKGVGTSEVRSREGPLIQAGIKFLAYTLLSLMIKHSKRLFRRILTTIGQCSRAIKEVLIFKRSYKSRLFSR